MNRKEEQYAKLSDTIYVSLMCGGLGSELSMIETPSFGLGYLILGLPFIIIGAFRVINWDIYYDHRISTLKWLMILLGFDLLAATVLFCFVTPMNIPGKNIFYLINVITIILLLILSFRKRNKLLLSRFM